MLDRLPFELQVAVLEHLIAPLSPDSPRAHYKSLLALCLSHSLRPAVQTILWRHVALPTQESALAWIASGRNRGEDRLVSMDLFVYGAGGGADCTGVEGATAGRVIASASYVRRLKLIFLGGLDEAVLEHESLQGLVSLELLTNVRHSSTTLNLPPNLVHLALSTWSYPATLITSLFHASPHLKSLAINVASNRAILLEGFCRVAGQLQHLKLANIGSLAKGFIPLLGQCTHLKRLELESESIAEVQEMLEAVPSQLDHLVTRTRIDVTAPESIVLWEACLELASMRTVKVWRFDNAVPAATGAMGWKAFVSRCRAKETIIV